MERTHAPADPWRLEKHLARYFFFFFFFFFFFLFFLFFLFFVFFFFYFFCFFFFLFFFFVLFFFFPQARPGFIRAEYPRYQQSDNRTTPLGSKPWLAELCSNVPGLLKKGEGSERIAHATSSATTRTANLAPGLLLGTTALNSLWRSAL